MSKKSFLPGIFRAHISILFLTLITAVFVINAVFYDFGTLQPTVKPGYSIIVLLCSSALFFALLHFKNRLQMLERTHVFFFIYLICTMLAAIIFYHDFAWDVSYTVDTVANYAKSPYFADYFLKHPNNLPYFSIILFLHTIVPVTASLFAPLLYLLNGLLITLSLTLIGMRLKKISIVWGKYFFIVALLFLPLLLYTTIPYTDTFSLIFIAIAFYLFTPALRSQRDWMNLLGSLFFLAIGALIKPSVILIIIAFSLIMFFAVKKPWFMKVGAFLLPFIFFLGISWLFSSFFVYGIMKGDKATLEKNSFPIEHYIFMGQNDKTFGIFSSEDDNSTRALLASGSDRISIKQTLLNKTAQRIKEREPEENGTFFIYKFSKVWGQPDFFLLQEGGDCHFRGLMVNQKCSDDEGSLYKNILLVMDILYTLILMIVLVGSYYTIRVKDEHVLVFVCKLSLIGIALFLIVWEARSRYLINFMPFILVLAAYYLTVLRGYVPK